MTLAELLALSEEEGEQHNLDAFLYAIGARKRQRADGEILPPRAPRIEPKVDFAFAVVRFAGQEIVVEK